MKIMDFDAHVAAKILKATEYVIYKLYVVACHIIYQKVLNYKH